MSEKMKKMEDEMKLMNDQIRNMKKTLESSGETLNSIDKREEKMLELIQKYDNMGNLFFIHVSLELETI